METLLLGAVAYDAKVVTIWDGFKDWFIDQGLAFDYVLFSNYERQVEALLDGHVHMAWNSPLAWARARRMAAARGASVHALAMRDTDRDLTSAVVVTAASGIDDVAGLAGRRVAVGAVDSPQATLIPLSHLRGHGLEAGRDFDVVRHNIGVGKHGDHIGGERAAALALLAGDVDAACMTDGNHLLFSTEGTLAPGSTRIVGQTAPYDHCNFTVADGAPVDLTERFAALLAAMSYDDPEVRTLLDLEGLKAWRPGRVGGYAQLETAVDETGFYDSQGNVTATDYRP